MSISKPIILITGANAGLGFEVIKALVKSSTGYEILVGSRSLKKGQDAISELKSEFPNSASSMAPIQVDIESDDSIQKAYEDVSSKFNHLDYLINNAGAAYDGEIASGAMTMREAWNKTYNVNVTGTHIMTHTFVPLLLKSPNPRLMFVTSGTSSLIESEESSYRINQPSPAGWPKPPGFALATYRSSKTGMNMMVREWVKTLGNDNVKIFNISPGFLATGLGQHGRETLLKLGAKEPSVGGEFIRDIVEGKRDSDVGKIIRKDMVQPW